MHYKIDYLGKICRFADFLLLNAVKLRMKPVPSRTHVRYGITLTALLFGGFRPFCTIFLHPLMRLLTFLMISILFAACASVFLGL